MYIERPKQEIHDAERTREDLKVFLEQPIPTEAPPCPGCTNHVKSKCSGDCSEAHTALSTQPKEFPIEPNVVPLVFALMSTRVTQTCWSCEGHMDSNNELIKLPTVSFYTSSPVYSQLLHRHVCKLNMDKKLSYPWHIVLMDYAQTWAQTYSIIPDLNYVGKNVHLGGLQNDLKIIARDLQQNMKMLAQEMILELDRWIVVAKKNVFVES